MRRWKKIFGQLQKRTTKMIIIPETIHHVRKISLAEFDEEETEKIQALHKELLGISMKKNDSNEVGLLVNLVNWEYLTVYGTENGISLSGVSDAKELLCTAPKSSLIFLHNHPKNSTFSEIDLESFLTADSLLMVTVIGNNGRQHFLIKTLLFDKYNALLHYNEVYESTGNGSIKEFLRTCKKVGLAYYYGGD